jgi:hypothetical protein
MACPRASLGVLALGAFAVGAAAGSAGVTGGPPGGGAAGAAGSDWANASEGNTQKNKEPERTWATRLFMAQGFDGVQLRGFMRG